MTRLLLAAFALALAAPALAGDEGFQVVDADAVQKMLRAGDVNVYDVNIDELWERHHLPGAVHVGSRDLASLLPSDRGARLVFYCSGPK
jgi:rhodanese-related sulfurtransferase